MLSNVKVDPETAEGAEQARERIEQTAVWWGPPRTRHCTRLYHDMGSQRLSRLPSHIIHRISRLPSYFYIEFKVTLSHFTKIIKVTSSNYTHTI